MSREYVAIVRSILAREEPVAFDGEYYQLPYAGEDATGLGKPLKIMLRPRKDIPIYLAAIGPRNVELTAEIADGWLPIFFSPERTREVYEPLLAAGFAASGDPAKADRFDILMCQQCSGQCFGSGFWNRDFIAVFARVTRA